jgi:hypothetical protein
MAPALLRSHLRPKVRTHVVAAEEHRGHLVDEDDHQLEEDEGAFGEEEVPEDS